MQGTSIGSEINSYLNNQKTTLTFWHYEGLRCLKETLQDHSDQIIKIRTHTIQVRLLQTHQF